MSYDFQGFNERIENNIQEIESQEQVIDERERIEKEKMTQKNDNRKKE